MAPGTKSLDTFYLSSFALPCPLPLSEASVVLFFRIYMQKTYLCSYTDRILHKYIHTGVSTRLVRVSFPAERNVLEPMDKEHSTNILLRLFFKKGREREELFNIRPSFGCTLSTTKYLWLQIRCKRGLERSFGFPAVDNGLLVGQVNMFQRMNTINPVSTSGKLSQLNSILIHL